MLGFAGLVMLALVAPQESEPERSTRPLRQATPQPGATDAVTNGEGSGFEIGGSVRGRAEHWEGFRFGQPSRDDDSFVLGRYRLHGEARFGRHVRVFAEGKSSQSSERDLPGPRAEEVDTLALQQLFLDAGWDGSETVQGRLRAGRWALSLGSERLVGPNDWSNTLRSWEGASALVTTDGGWRIEGFWTRFVPVETSERNEADPDEEFFGIYARAPQEVAVASHSGGAEYYWLGLNRRDQSYNGTTGNEFRHTIGTRQWGEHVTGLFFEAEGAAQFGNIGDESISAYMLTYLVWLELWEASVAPWLAADYATGDEEAGGSVQTFNQLYPRHEDLGTTDTIGRQNILDLSGGVDWRPASNLEVGFGTHVFYLADEADALYDARGVVLRPGDSAISEYVGVEADLTVRLHTGEHFWWEAGYAHFFAGAALRQSGADEDVDFAYLSANLSF